MTPQLFNNIEFFALLPAILILLNLAKRVHSAAFKIGLLTAGAGVLWIYPGLKPGYFWILAGIVPASYVLLWPLVRWRQGWVRPFLAGLGLAIVGVGFLLLKYTVWTRLHPSLISFQKGVAASLLPAIGFSYLAVKLHSTFMDAWNGKIERLPFLDYVLYLFHFPCFLSGPIERFRPFSEMLQRSLDRRSPLHDLSRTFPRLVLGAFKAFVLAPLILPYTLAQLTSKQWSHPGILYLGFITYYWYEYINFSGYTDMAVGTSGMLGVEISENFDSPFLATSLSNLWRRWHMTLAHWLRDYIFYPLTLILAKWIGFDRKFNRALTVGTAIFLTFTLCGLWHGQTYGVLFFGCFSGLVMALELTLEIYAKPSWDRTLRDRRWLRILYPNAARLWTIHLAAFSFGPVLLNNRQFIDLIARLNPMKF